jgi:hypothetical protein
MDSQLWDEGHVLQRKACLPSTYLAVVANCAKRKLQSLGTPNIRGDQYLVAVALNVVHHATWETLAQAYLLNGVLRK